MSQPKRDDLFKSLSSDERNSIKDLEDLLQASRVLDKGATIPLIFLNEEDIGITNIGIGIKDNAVIAIFCRYCALTSLPESLGQFPYLQHLDVTGNQLTTLPESLGNLLYLERLFVDDNQLTTLPESLGNLPHLRELHADGNQLISLPTTLCQLTKLETLRVYGNQLDALPADIRRLISLKDISIGKNRFTALPDTFWQLSRLRSLENRCARYFTRAISRAEVYKILCPSDNNLHSRPFLEAPSIHGGEERKRPTGRKSFKD